MVAFRTLPGSALTAASMAPPCICWPTCGSPVPPTYLPTYRPTDRPTARQRAQQTRRGNSLCFVATLSFPGQYYTSISSMSVKAHYTFTSPVSVTGTIFFARCRASMGRVCDASGLVSCDACFFFCLGRTYRKTTSKTTTNINTAPPAPAAMPMMVGVDSAGDGDGEGPPTKLDAVAEKSD